jgi:hypothetical protein
MNLPGQTRPPTSTEQGSHTATTNPVVLQIRESPSYRLRIQARLLPPFSRQAQRASSGRDQLPDLDPLLEVWERDLLPWETDPIPHTDQTLPWEGDTFAWEPASRNSIPFTTSRKTTNTPHRKKHKCRKPQISSTRRTPRAGKPG